MDDVGLPSRVRLLTKLALGLSRSVTVLLRVRLYDLRESSRSLFPFADLVSGSLVSVSAGLDLVLDRATCRTVSSLLLDPLVLGVEASSTVAGLSSVDAVNGGLLLIRAVPSA